MLPEAAAFAGRVRPGAVRLDAGCGPGSDLEALPFRGRSLGGAWARNSYVHVPKVRLPMALARLHDALDVGAPAVLTFISGDREGLFPDDDFPGRFFALWRVEEIVPVVE